MKKIILTILLAITFITTYGQNKYQERQNNYFVEAAAKEFNLNESQKNELKDIRMTMVSAYINANKQEKNGDIVAEEKKRKTMEASKIFNNAVIKLTGKTYEELKPFFSRMREELKKVK
ncbi:hypothetical protein [Aquimarina algiphila]|uniref:hypothetical protein n=1 Tax=Aquimarina algiphila TaxID=2047982 RepID=UPI002492FEE5|nr:hypothetical protein [Aquimarina algiphila]